MVIDRPPPLYIANSVRYRRRAPRIPHTPHYVVRRAEIKCEKPKTARLMAPAGVARNVS